MASVTIIQSRSMTELNGTPFAIAKSTPMQATKNAHETLLLSGPKVAGMNDSCAFNVAIHGSRHFISL